MHELPAGIEDAERDGAQWFVTVNDIAPDGWRSMLAALHAVSAPLVAGSGPIAVSVRPLQLAGRDVYEDSLRERG